jgi:hypothetical protein
MEVRRAAVRLIEQLEAVPSAPGAAGARVWHLLSRGWGPRTGARAAGGCYSCLAHSPNHWYGDINLERLPVPESFSEEQRVDSKVSQIHLA